MRKVHKVGVWPVGLVGGMMVERPIVDTSGKKVLSFNSVWRPERPFPIDMAGFAIHLHLLKKHPSAVFTHKVQAGYQVLYYKKMHIVYLRTESSRLFIITSSNLIF